MNIPDILTSTLYSNGVATIAMIVACVAVPASGYFSYKFAIKGEKRKEWNAIADPIMRQLLLQKDELRSGSRPNQFIKKEQIVSLLVVGDFKHPNQIEAAFEQYTTSIGECGSYDDWNCSYSLHSPELMINAIDHLMSFVKHK